MCCNNDAMSNDASGAKRNMGKGSKQSELTH